MSSPKLCYLRMRWLEKSISWEKAGSQLQLIWISTALAGAYRKARSQGAVGFVQLAGEDLILLGLQGVVGGGVGWASLAWVSARKLLGLEGCADRYNFWGVRALWTRGKMLYVGVSRNGSSRKFVKEKNIYRWEELGAIFWWMSFLC